MLVPTGMADAKIPPSDSMVSLSVPVTVVVFAPVLKDIFVGAFPRELLPPMVIMLSVALESAVKIVRGSSDVV